MTPARFSRTALLLAFAAAAGCAAPGAGLLPAPPMAIRKEAPQPARPSDNTAVRAPDNVARLAADNAAAAATDNAAPAPPPPPEGWPEYTEAIARTREAIARQKPAEAVAAWKPVEAGPYRSDAIFHQGVLLHLSGDIAGAEAQYRRGTEKPPVDPPSAANLLGIYLMQGQTAKARELADRAIPPSGPGPDTPELLNNAGAALLESGDTAKADTLLSRLEGKGADSAAATWNRAVLAWRKGDSAKARELSGALPPETARLWPVTASRAAWDRDAAGRIAEEHSAAPAGDRRLAPLAKNFEAYSRYRQGKVDDADRILSEAIQSGAGSPELLSNLGWIRIERGKWKEGRELLERVAKEHPALPEAWFNLGVFREVYAGDAPGAVECYRKYVTLGGYRKDEVAKWIEWLQKPAPPSSP